MKLERKNREVFGGIGKKSITASISEKDMDKMWEAIENPYKNPISSIVREYTSNCFDAHADAGVSDAVRIKFGRNESGYYIGFIDVGTGMSPELMEDIFTKVYASTKEESNLAIGAFGIGSKSGLSYNNFFEIITRVDGIEYNYVYAKGELRPSLELIDDVKTKERNGTEIRINIKNNDDLKDFINACHEQLYYFTNVIFDYKELLQHVPEYKGYRKDVFDHYNHSLNDKYITDRLDNDFVIQEGKHFKIRINKQKGYDSNLKLHLINGPVKYPIDRDNIQNEFISNFYENLPIALKFDIGELDVIQTREDLKYTRKTIDAINKKCEAIEVELREMYEEQNKFVGNDPVDIFSKNIYETAFLTFGKGDYKLTNFYNPYFKTNKYNTSNKIISYDPLKGISSITSSFFFDRLFKSSLRFSNVTAKKEEGRIFTTSFGASYNNNILSKELSSLTDFKSNMNYVLRNLKDFKEKGNVIYIMKENPHSNLSVKIKKQLLYKDGYGSVVIIDDLRNKRKLLSHKQDILKYYERVKVDKKDWRKVITEYTNAEDKIIDHLVSKKVIIKESDYKLDDKWYKKFSDKHRLKRGNIDTTKVKITRRLFECNTYTYRCLKFTWETDKETISNLANSRRFTIFVDDDSKDKLLFIERLLEAYGRNPEGDLSKYLNMNLIYLAKTNYKKLKKEKRVNNVLTYEEFMSNKNNKKFEFLSDLHLIYKLKKEYPQLYSLLEKDSLTTYYKMIGVLSKRALENFENISKKIKPFVHIFRYNEGQINSLFQNELKDLSDNAKIEDLITHEIEDELVELNNFNCYFYPYLRVESRSYDMNTDLLAVMASEYKPVKTKEFLNPVFLKSISQKEYEKIRNSSYPSNEDIIKLALYEYKNKKQINIRNIKL